MVQNSDLGERIIYGGAFDGRNYYIFLKNPEELLYIPAHFLRGELIISRKKPILAPNALDYEIYTKSDKEIMDYILSKNLHFPVIAAYGRGFRKKDRIWLVRSLIGGREEYPLSNPRNIARNTVIVVSSKSPTLDNWLRFNGVRIN